jgi:hypothetical protein
VFFLSLSIKMKMPGEIAVAFSPGIASTHIRAKGGLAP